MEPLAAIQLLKYIFYNSNSYVRIMVMDDDSSTVANCKHSYTEKIEKGLMTANEWPKTEKGNKRKDAGLLPIEIPEPESLADPTHRAKCVAAKIFGLQKKHGTRGTAVTGVDAHRIKLYWVHWQKQSRNKQFHEFKHNSNAVIEHLFNDHTYCSDDWCPVKKAQARQEEYKGEYRSKVEHAREYQQIRNAIGPYLTDEKLKEIHHPFDSQKNESFNKSVSKYAPKGRTYSMTMALTARICIAAGVANVGAYKYWTEVMDGLGIAKGDHTEAFLLDKTRRVRYKHEYQCSIPVKRKRTEMKSKKWRDIMKKQGNEEKAGLNYQTGVRNGDDEEEDSDDARRPNKRIRRLKNKTVCKKPCVRCGRWDHTRLCSSCPASKDYPPELDELYKEWEAEKRCNGEIRGDDVGGEHENLEELNREA
jgi:hypothetical protein